MDEGYKLIYSGFQIILNNWLYQVLFSWKWWLVVSISIIPWVVTYFYLKKEKRKQYFISSLLIMVFSAFLDITGLSYDLWRYYVTPLPVMGGFFPWNFSIIPVFYILAYELLPKWSPILKGIIVSFMFAFIGEPIADYLGLTVHQNWKHLYSTPIYFGIYLIAYYGGVILSKKQRRSDSEPEEKNLTDKYHYAFEHSYDAIYLIEK
ncbi:MAG TPA: CBO0543 family protein, partial [Pseudoneobacillus sp.]|nr:CBO0543 family protein [Pseudoneobacillus sp.]